MATSEEEARIEYWKAVGILNDILESGEMKRQEIMDELEEDLNE